MDLNDSPIYAHLKKLGNNQIASNVNSEDKESTKKEVADTQKGPTDSFNHASLEKDAGTWSKTGQALAYEDLMDDLNEELGFDSIDVQWELLNEDSLQNSITSQADYFIGDISE